MLSMQEINGLFHDLFVKVTGLPGQRVRGTNQWNSQPKFTKGEDYLYYWIITQDDEIAHTADTEYKAVDDEKAEKVITYNRVLQVQVTAYGDNASDILRVLRLALLDKSQTKMLREAKIHVVTNIPESTLTWEDYNNNWIPRADLTVNYNMLTTNDGIQTKEPIYYVTGSSITIKTDQGHDRDIDFEK